MNIKMEQVVKILLAFALLLTIGCKKKSEDDAPKQTPQSNRVASAPATPQSATPPEPMPQPAPSPAPAPDPLAPQPEPSPVPAPDPLAPQPAPSPAPQPTPAPSPVVPAPVPVPPMPPVSVPEPAPAPILPPVGEPSGPELAPPSASPDPAPTEPIRRSTPATPVNPSEQSCIVINIWSKEELYFNIVAAPGKEGEVWVDLNGNAQREENEQIIRFGIEPSNVNRFSPYTSEGDLSFYGPIEVFSIGPNYRTVGVKSVKGSDLKVLDLAGVRNLSQLPLDQLTHLEYLNLSDVKEPFRTGNVDFSKFTKLKTLIMRNVHTPQGITLPESSVLEYIDLTGNNTDYKVNLKNQSNLKTFIASDSHLFSADEVSSLPNIEQIELVNSTLYYPDIEEILKQLPSRSGKSKGHLYIANNPGVGKVEVTTAESKNWEVDVKDLRNDAITYPDMTIEKW